MVKTSPSSVGGVGSIPGRRAKSHVHLSHKTKTEITSIVTNSKKALEVVHIKKNNLRKEFGTRSSSVDAGKASEGCGTGAGSSGMSEAWVCRVMGGGSTSEKGRCMNGSFWLERRTPEWNGGE